MTVKYVFLFGILAALFVLMSVCRIRVEFLWPRGFPQGLISEPHRRKDRIHVHLTKHSFFI